MVHLHELLRAGAVDPIQHAEPTTGRGQRESGGGQEGGGGEEKAASQQKLPPQGCLELPPGSHKGEQMSRLPGILWRLCIDLVGSLICHHIQCVFLLVIVHNLPARHPNRLMLSFADFYR